MKNWKSIGAKINETKHFSNIDLLRILAAFSIVVFHLFGEFTIRKYDNPALNFFLLRYGILSTGVDLFFVISGFVITRSILIRIPKPLDFIQSRLKRILPSYWAITILTLALNYVTNNLGYSRIPYPTFESIFSSLLFCSQIFGFSGPFIAQGWTLEFEMLFYIFVGLALTFNNKNALMKIIYISLILVVTSISFKQFFLLIEFMSGILVAVLNTRYIIDRKIGFGLLITSVGILTFLFFNPIVFPNRSIYSILYGILLLGALNVAQLKYRLLGYLGQVSYHVYLTQGLVIPISYQYIKLKSDFNYSELLLIFSISSISIFILSLCFYEFIDKPIRARF